MSTATIDLVLFEIAGVRYATDLMQVRRIGSVGEGLVAYPLGRPKYGKRALVFAAPGTDEQEAQLAIDSVLGVHTVPVDDLRRLPLAVAASPMAVGAWVVDGSQTVLLIDLHAMTDFQNREPKGSA